MKDMELLEDLAEFLEGQADIVDRSNGEPAPNEAMSLLMRLKDEIAKSPSCGEL